MSCRGIYRLLFVMLAAISVFAVCRQEVYAAEEDYAEEKDYAEGEVLIAVKRSETTSGYRKLSKKTEFLTENSELASVIADLSYVSSAEGESSSGSMITKKKTKSGSVLDIYVAKLQEDISVETAVCTLNQESEIYLAEPNYTCQVFDVSYPYEQDAYVEQEQWYLQTMDVVPAWKKMEDSQVHPGEGVTVAVIDTGVSLLHEDLLDNIIVNQAEAEGEEGVDDDGNGYIDDVNGVNLVNSYTAMTDSTGHGTRMAGLIAMTAGNGGGAGVAYAARIMPVKVSTDGNFNIDKAIEGIEYAAANGADVINMSFGTYRESEIFQMAIEKAAKECILVAAAGNDSKANGTTGDNAYPAAYSSVIGVMSMDKDGTFSDFSNWDTQENENISYELIAPGRDIWSTALKNSYKTTSGTSAASAMTAGVLAVYRSLFPERDIYGASFLTENFLASMKHKVTANTSDGSQYEYAVTNLSDVVEEVENVRNSVQSSETESQPTETESQSQPWETESQPTETESQPTETESQPEATLSPQATLQPGTTMSSQATMSPEVTLKSSETAATSEGTVTSKAATQSDATGQSKTSRTAKAIKSKKPVIKVTYLKNGKARLTFKIKGYSGQTGYYVYVSKSKGKGFRKYKVTKKNKLIVSSKKKRYYQVVAYKKTAGKRYKSRKSEAVKCSHS